jgi:hypothetical protein
MVPGNTVSAAEHNPSRRALLGAAAALPFVGAAASPSSFPRKRESLPSLCTSPANWIPDQVRDDGEWKRALAAYRKAEAELRAFERRTAGLPWQEQEAVEREMDERLDALGPALLRLIEAPAPDLEALAVKIETIIAHEAWSASGGEDCLAELGRDVRRLTKG